MSSEKQAEAVKKKKKSTSTAQMEMRANCRVWRKISGKEDTERLKKGMIVGV